MTFKPPGPDQTDSQVIRAPRIGLNSTYPPGNTKTPPSPPTDDGPCGTDRSAYPSPADRSDTAKQAASPANSAASPAAPADPDRRTCENLNTYISKMIDDAPPLTSEQRDKLALILRRKLELLEPRAARVSGQGSGPSRTRQQRSHDRCLHMPHTERLTGVW
jgi:hypothetical protein